MKADVVWGYNGTKTDNICTYKKKYREIEHKRTHILKQKNNFGGDGGIQY